MAWVNGGILTNPALDAILADSGALAAGQSSVKVMLGGNIACVATVEHRNAANAANINSQTVAIVANQVLELEFPGITFSASERIRVRNNAAIVGSVHASIFTF
jgi:hypothetical protein